MRSAKIHASVVAPIAIAACSSAIAFNGPTTDDSFITLHFARSLVNGDGLVFNAGDPVEGFTSPLHLLLAASTYLAPGATYQLLKLKLASLLIAVAGLFFARRILQNLDLEDRQIRVAVAGMAASAIFAVTATNALETAMVMLLTTWLVAASTANVPPAALMFGGVSAAALLTRPDAAPVVLGVWIGLLLQRRGLKTQWWFSAAVTALAPVAAYEAFRIAYFGHPLPNTYYAKHMPFQRSLVPGIEYLMHALVPEFPSQIPNGVGDVFVATVGLLATAAVLVVLAAGGKRVIPRRGQPIVGAVAGQVFVCVFTGGESIGLRFLAPVWLIVCVLFVCGFEALSKEKVSGEKAQRYLAAGAVALSIGVLSLQWEAGRVRPIWISTGFDDQALLKRRSESGFGALWANSEVMLQCVPSGATVAYSEMGYAFWVRPDLNAIDLRGLVDEQVAHEAPTELHTFVGVVDEDWRSSSSFTGRLLRRRKPEFILSIEPDQGADAIGHRYKRVRAFNYGHVEATLYRRFDVVC